MKIEFPLSELADQRGSSRTRQWHVSWVLTPTYYLRNTYPTDTSPTCILSSSFMRLAYSSQIPRYGTEPSIKPLLRSSHQPESRSLSAHGVVFGFVTRHPNRAFNAHHDSTHLVSTQRQLWHVTSRLQVPQSQKKRTRFHNGQTETTASQQRHSHDTIISQVGTSNGFLSQHQQI